MAAKKIGIISIKGGVGKTSAVAALGASLANDFNKRVLLVDANFSAPNLGLHVGVINPEATLSHALADKVKIEDSIHETEYGFHIIPGSILNNKVEKLNPFKLKEKLKELEKYYDFILIDSSPTLNNEILATMLASDQLFLVTTPDYVTLVSTLRAVNVAKKKNIPISGLILNKVHNKNFEISLDDIEKACESKVLAVLPHDINVLEALSKNLPSTLHKNTEAALEYKKLAAAIAGEEYRVSPLKSFFRKFMNLIPKQEVNRAIFQEEGKIGYGPY